MLKELEHGSISSRGSLLCCVFNMLVPNKIIQAHISWLQDSSPTHPQPANMDGYYYFIDWSHRVIEASIFTSYIHSSRRGRRTLNTFLL
jgi:hypothetical protein